MAAATAAAMVPTVFMTVADMADRYVTKLLAYDKPTYCHAVRTILKTQLVDHYGSMCINDFTIADASATIGRMRRVPYPNASINLYCGVIRAAFESELRNGRLIDNPWNHIKLPQRDHREKRTLSDREVRLLGEAFRHNALGPFFGFVMHTGLKRTEAAAVIEGNWDCARHQLLVNTHLDYHGKEGTRLVREPYNGVSHLIPLSEEAEHCLEEELRRRDLRQEASTCWNNPDCLVFTQGPGQPLSRDYIWFNQNVVRQMTGIEDFTLGRLRDHFVVQRLNSGVPIHLLETYLGMRNRDSVIDYANMRSTGTVGAAQTLEDYFNDLVPDGRQA